MRNQTIAQNRETIRRLAIEAFARHEIHEIGTAGDVQVFRCSRPESGVYWFELHVSPGWIVLFGDIGDTIFAPRSGRGLGWIRGAIGSPDYFLSKIQGKRRVFFPGEALAYIKEIETGHGEYTPEKRPADPEEAAEWDREASRYRERAEAIREAWSEDDPESVFYGACVDAGDDEPRDCADYDNDHLWAMEALRWFIGAYDKRQAASAAVSAT